MSDPISKLFGGGGGDNPMNPLLMMAMMPKMPDAPPPLQTPSSSPNAWAGNMAKPKATFASSSAPAPTAGQTGGKTLLGQ